MFRHTLVNQFLEYSAERFPGKTALVHLDKRLTYRELDLMANRLANTLLSVGVERGDRVVLNFCFQEDNLISSNSYIMNHLLTRNPY